MPLSNRSSKVGTVLEMPTLRRELVIENGLGSITSFVSHESWNFCTCYKILLYTITWNFVQPTFHFCSNQVSTSPLQWRHCV